jgi:AcrR family transcriptional regulator
MNRRDRKEHKRLSILLAATDLFVEKDFHDVLMDEVAARAGVGKGTLYRYFPAKEDLYLAAIFAGWEHLHEELQRVVTEKGPAGDTLRKIAEEILGYFWSRRDFVTLVYRLEQKRGGKEWAIWQRRRKGTVAIVEGVLRRRPSPSSLAHSHSRLLAEIFLGMLRAVVLHRSHRDQPKGLARLVVDVFLSGIVQAGQQKINRP